MFGLFNSKYILMKVMIIPMNYSPVAHVSLGSSRRPLVNLFITLASTCCLHNKQLIMLVHWSLLALVRSTFWLRKVDLTSGL